jgi:hypothetical protein
VPLLFEPLHDRVEQGHVGRVGEIDPDPHG